MKRENGESTTTNKYVIFSLFLSIYLSFFIFSIFLYIYLFSSSVSSCVIIVFRIDYAQVLRGYAAAAGAAICATSSIFLSLFLSQFSISSIYFYFVFFLSFPFFLVCLIDKVTNPIEVVKTRLQLQGTLQRALMLVIIYL